MQQLVQPINKMTVTASYLNNAYERKFGYKHYGVDLVGELQAWCQGNGIVAAKGVDNTYGNFVVIVYPDCSTDDEFYGTVVATYCHLASFGANIEVGNFVTKDTKLGYIGQTGNAFGVHLHVEMRAFGLNPARMVSAFNTSKFKADLKAGWINPLSLTTMKTSAPDNQTRRFSDTTYTNAVDREPDNIMKWSE